MKNEDYPALFQALDTASSAAQSTFVRCIKSYGWLLIIGATFSLIGISSKEFALVAAVVFLATLSISILIATKHFERTWYKGRIIAESIKTIAWLYMMQSEPFESAQAAKEAPKAKLRNRLQEILSGNRDLAQHIGGEFSRGEQVTERMDQIRDSFLEERKGFYENHRLEDQRAWYASKSDYNKKQNRLWLIIMIVLQALAVITVLMRIAYPDWKYWPTEVFIVAAGAALFWTQFKRFQELAAAYALSAHEIGVTKGKLKEVKTESELSNFVKNSESAFSKEHTHWVARRDV